MIVIQPKPSTSTPLSFFKLKPSTSTPTSSDKSSVLGRQRSTTLLYGFKSNPERGKFRSFYRKNKRGETLDGSSDSLSESSLSSVEDSVAYETILLEPEYPTVHKPRPRPRPVSLLQKSKKWSQPSQPLPPLTQPHTTFLDSPGARLPATSTLKPPFLFLHRLLESMMYGGRITDRLHIPVDLWYQPGVCLPFVQAKITACELLIAILENMHDPSQLPQQLSHLHQTLLQINDSLMRKLGCAVYPIPHRTLQSRLSRIIRLDRNNPGDDTQNKLYIKILIKLLTDAQVLEDVQPGFKKGSQTLNCIPLFVSLVSNLIMKDYEILLDQWFKQSSGWIQQ